MPKHKSGFVNIIGSPNVGKSTLMNQLLGENISIITSKAQTTRHRIMGIVSGDDFQIIYSDTPGLVKPAYKLHENMMSYVHTAMEDADVILFITDCKENEPNDPKVLERINEMDIPILLLINKIDLVEQEEVEKRIDYWHERMPNASIAPISALHGFNTELVFEKILELLPEGPAFYPKDQLTDRPLRFFVSEIIREKILKHYKQEIPYSAQVEVEDYEEGEKQDEIHAIIYVSRDSQKGIIIGHKGAGIKRIGIEARKEIEQMIGKRVNLRLFVKTKKDWRNDERTLRSFGY